jgi:hypothetical protein
MFGPVLQVAATFKEIVNALGVESHVPSDQHGTWDLATLAHIRHGSGMKARNLRNRLRCNQFLAHQNNPFSTDQARISATKIGGNLIVQRNW